MNLAKRYAAERGQAEPGLRENVRAVRRAADAVAVIAALAIAWERGAGENGRPTQAEYAEWWRYRGDSGRRHVEREWELVRQAFPGEEGPVRLAELIVTRRLAREQKTPQFALSLPADGPHGLLLAG